MPKSVDYVVRLGIEKSPTTLNLLAENVNLIFVKQCKVIGSHVRKLRAFRDSDYGWCQSRKNSWRQVLLHSRTAGAERVKVNELTDKPIASEISSKRCLVSFTQT